MTSFLHFFFILYFSLDGLMDGFFFFPFLFSWFFESTSFISTSYRFTCCFVLFALVCLDIVDVPLLTLHPSLPHERFTITD